MKNWAGIFLLAVLCVDILPAQVFFAPDGSPMTRQNSRQSINILDTIAEKQKPISTEYNVNSTGMGESGNSTGNDFSTPGKNSEELVVMPTVDRPVLPAEIAVLLGGGPGGPWFHAGVLQAAHQFRVPLGGVYATSWGNVVATLWQHGYQGEEIFNLLSGDSLVVQLWRESRQEKPMSPASPTWLEEGSFPRYGKEWVIHVANTQKKYPLTRNLQMENSELKANLLRLRLQNWRARYARRGERRVSTAHWEESSGGVRWLDIDVSDAWFCGLPLEANGNLCQHGVSDEVLFALPIQSLNSSLKSIPLMASSSWPLRYENELTAARARFVEQRILATQALQEGGAIILQPHRELIDSTYYPQYWYRLGYYAMRASLGRVWRVVEKPAPPATASHRQPADLQVGVVRMENIPAQFHSHLESFAREAGIGVLSDSAGLSSLAHRLHQSGIYDSLIIFYNRSLGEVILQGRPRTLVQLWAGGLADAAIGPTAAVGGRLRLVSQMEYNFNWSAYWGAAHKGFIPSVALQRIQGSRFGFEVGGVFLHTQGEPYYRNSSTPFAEQILEQDINLARLSLEWSLADKKALTVQVEAENNFFRTGTSEHLRLVENVRLSRRGVQTRKLSLEGYYADSVGNFQKWFNLRGGARHLHMGFRAVSVSGLGNSSAPLYLRLRLEEERAFAVRPFLSLAGTLGAGRDLLAANMGKLDYPDSLEVVPEQWSDPALGDYYRQHLWASPGFSRWLSPEFSSHGWAMGRLSAALHHREEIGVWGFAGVIRDFEGASLDSEQQVLLFGDLLLRLKKGSWEFIGGVYQQAWTNDLQNDQTAPPRRFYLRVGKLGLFP